MNISLRPLALVVGSIAGILSILTIKNPLFSLLIAVVAIILAEGVLNLQDKS